MNSADSNCANCGLEIAFDAPSFDSPSQRFTLARCPSCGLTSTQHVSDAVLAEAYASAYYGGGEAKFAGPIEGTVRLLAERRAAGLLRRWAAGGGAGVPRVLDIGCGRGTLLGAFRNLGAVVLGLERESFAAPAELADCIEVGALGDARFEDERFDIIAVWHVLEHLRQVDDLIEQAARHLAPRGLLVVAVPNFDSLQGRAFGPHWFHLDLPRHVVHIESPWLRRRLTSAGLDIEAASHVDLLQNTYGFIQSVMNAIAPRNPNEFYQLLKAGAATNPLRLVAWALLASVLVPIALLETILGALSGRGATVAMIARGR